jgi:hypothetical protein
VAPAQCYETASRRGLPCSHSPASRVGAGGRGEGEGASRCAVAEATRDLERTCPTETRAFLRRAQRHHNGVSRCSRPCLDRPLLHSRRAPSPHSLDSWSVTSVISYVGPHQLSTKSDQSAVFAHGTPMPQPGGRTGPVRGLSSVRTLLALGPTAYYQPANYTSSSCDERYSACRHSCTRTAALHLSAVRKLLLDRLGK